MAIFRVYLLETIHPEARPQSSLLTAVFSSHGLKTPLPRVLWSELKLSESPGSKRRTQNGAMLGHLMDHRTWECGRREKAGRGSCLSVGWFCGVAAVLPLGGILFNEVPSELGQSKHLISIQMPNCECRIFAKIL